VKATRQTRYMSAQLNCPMLVVSLGRLMVDSGEGLEWLKVRVYLFDCVLEVA